jgi:hypothetical protein
VSGFHAIQTNDTVHVNPAAIQGTVQPTYMLASGIVRVVALSRSLKSALSVTGLCTLSGLVGLLLFEVVDDHRFQPKPLQTLDRQSSQPELAFTATPVQSRGATVVRVQVNSAPLQPAGTEFVAE